MAITINNVPKAHTAQRGHSNALPRVSLDQPARLRVGHLMTLYGLSHSSIYAHLRKKLIPEPDGVISGRSYWRTDTIRKDLER